MVILLCASKFATAEIECIASKWTSKHLRGVSFILLLTARILNVTEILTLIVKNIIPLLYSCTFGTLTKLSIKLN